MDLSVIIPAYNMQNYIATCLRSVTRCPKDTIDMECLVINDGSTDDTAVIVERYVQRDRRIRLINKENGGVSDTRNKGIEAADGRYLMFLDADDALWEDAWDYICAAVEEEYADFTAFSYITLYENGKTKMQMLPISDAISTDEQEARRLMYADSEFNTCWGKLFRKEIISENEITFRTDLPVGEDFLFVAEYFGHCKSFFMTKAAILYYLQRSGSAMRSYSMDERLGFTKILYDFNVDAVAHCNDDILKKRMQVYYLKVLTNLFYEYAKVYQSDKVGLEAAYQSALENQTVQTILEEVAEGAIPSKMKKFEYKLLKRGNVSQIRRYFSLKARL